jgi:DnaK suppressor protein
MLTSSISTALRPGYDNGDWYRNVISKKDGLFQATAGNLHCRIGADLRTTEREARASEAKHADPADQAASEYERQTLAHKAARARQTLKALKEALSALQKGRFGECAECGGDIELKRLEAIPWAGYCIRCQEASEQQ